VGADDGDRVGDFEGDLVGDLDGDVLGALVVGGTLQTPPTQTPVEHCELSVHCFLAQ